jgi:APA family basic amino acid/polyamine antiporter
MGIAEKGIWQDAKRLFITRPVDEKPAEGTSLKRILGPLDLILLGIGAIIGTGIFVLSGIAIKDYAGPAIIISFIITGIVCAIVAMCYAELSSMIPKAGSAYAFTYTTMGELAAWIIGWTMIMEYSFGATAVSIGWSGYVNGLLESMGILLPDALTNGPFTPGGFFNLPAALIVLFITAILVVGIKESARFNGIIVVTKIAVLILFVGLGVFLMKMDNFEPFSPYGLGGILSGAGLVFFAYVGFDALATVSEETKNPQRNLPIGIIGSLLICTVIYISVAVVLIGMVYFREIDVKEPLAHALRLHGLGWASAIIAVGALAGITSVLLVNLMAQPRVIFAIARDGMLPKKLASIHPRFKTPWVPTILFGVVVALMAGFMKIDTAATLTNIGTLFAFILVTIGVVILRHKAKHMKRSFKIPLSPVLPLIGTIMCIVLIFFLPWRTKMIFLGWIGVGLIIYAFYGYHNSELFKSRNGGQK